MALRLAPYPQRHSGGTLSIAWLSHPPRITSLPEPLPPPSLLSFLLIFSESTRRCRPHRNEGVLNRSPPLMPFPGCLRSSIKRLPSSARILLVVADLLWFDLFAACLCNSLKLGFPFRAQNADLFGKGVISLMHKFTRTGFGSAQQQTN